jgi:hypothetical protein
MRRGRSPVSGTTRWPGLDVNSGDVHVQLRAALGSVYKTLRKRRKRGFDSPTQVGSRQAMATAVVGDALGENPLSLTGR